VGKSSDGGGEKTLASTRFQDLVILPRWSEGKGPKALRTKTGFVDDTPIHRVQMIGR